LRDWYIAIFFERTHHYEVLLGRLDQQELRQEEPTGRVDQTRCRAGVPGPVPHIPRDDREQDQKRHDLPNEGETRLCNRAVHGAITSNVSSNPAAGLSVATLSARK
jgi:hypothetical protein